ncbi:hypothetical protein [Arthrobacter sp. KNU40]|uniref:hypothetical protein n=1 Tax=Arthrobacter sp. KNU40 TaxID=3447965 RepID=UPI003F61DB31
MTYQLLSSFPWGNRGANAGLDGAMARGGSPRGFTVRVIIAREPVPIDRSVFVDLLEISVVKGRAPYIRALEMSWIGGALFAVAGRAGPSSGRPQDWLAVQFVVFGWVIVALALATTSLI